jgi:hypothetical protein
MSKYAALKSHLRQTGLAQVRMSFHEIEQVLGFALPSSAWRHRAWWSNNASNNVMTHAWLDAGYATEDVDMAGGQVTFVARRGQAPGEQQLAGRAGSIVGRPPLVSGEPGALPRPLPRPSPRHQVLSGSLEGGVGTSGPPSGQPAAHEAMTAVFQGRTLRPGAALSSDKESGPARLVEAGLVEAGLPDRTRAWLRDAAPTQEGRAAMIIDAIEAMAARARRLALLDRYGATPGTGGPATAPGGVPGGLASDSTDLIREDRDGR